MINEWIRLRWERGTRYYEAHLHQDSVWGDWVFTQVWGRRGTELGRGGTYPLRLLSGWTRAADCGSGEVGAKGL